MNAATLIKAAEHDGLRLELTVAGTVNCIGPKSATERWAPQLRQYKAEIVAALTLVSDNSLVMDEAEAFWSTFIARVDHCDSLIHALCDIRNDTEKERADLLASRKRTSPENLDSNITHLTAEIATLTPATTTGRCIECQHFVRVRVGLGVGVGERCSHPNRSLSTEPPRAQCLPDHRCEQFIHWKTTT